MAIHTLEIPLLIESIERGIITYDDATSEYTVWDETFANVVAKTTYPYVAAVALAAYVKEYLH